MECFFACAYGPQSTFVAPIMHTIIFLREIVCALFQLRLRQYWQLCTLSLAVLRNNAVNFFYCGYLDSALEHSWVDACSLYKKKKKFYHRTHIALFHFWDKYWRACEKHCEESLLFDLIWLTVHWLTVQFYHFKYLILTNNRETNVGSATRLQTYRLCCTACLSWVGFFA